LFDTLLWGVLVGSKLDPFTKWSKRALVASSAWNVGLAALSIELWMLRSGIACYKAGFPRVRT